MRKPKSKKPEYGYEFSDDGAVDMWVSHKRMAEVWSNLNKELYKLLVKHLDSPWEAMWFLQSFLTEMEKLTGVTSTSEQQDISPKVQ